MMARSFFLPRVTQRSISWNLPHNGSLCESVLSPLPTASPWQPCDCATAVGTFCPWYSPSMAPSPQQRTRAGRDVASPLVLLPPAVRMTGGVARVAAERLLNEAHPLRFAMVSGHTRNSVAVQPGEAIVLDCHDSQPKCVHCEGKRRRACRPSQKARE